VLISIAIVSAILGSAYAITNRNVENSQQAQEHSQALKVAETQLEQLKSYLASGGTEPADQENFCMNLDTSSSPTTNEKVIFSVYMGLSSPLPTVDANYPNPKCRKNDSGAVTGRYMTGVKRVSDTYTAYVSWDGPTGHREQVSLVYKVYP
jgi:type II secretory pathway pseudopilin PulG